MVADVAGIVASLVVLTVAGDQFVIGLARSAAALNARPIVVGALVGGFGTSLPELLVAAVATAERKPEIAVGNLVGSNIANVCVGLGLAAMVAPVRVESRTLRREAPLCVAAVVLLAVTAVGGFARVEGFLLLAALVAAVAALFVNARRGDYDLVVGNVLGSNLFISLAGGAIVGLIPGGSVPGIGPAPLWLMIGVMAATWAFMGRGGRVSRAEAALLIVAYGAALPFASR